jgi:D-3-phosphoglycerate dehydrogenase
MKKKILIADDVDTGAFAKFSKTRFELSYKPGISNEDILLINCDALVIRSTRHISKEFAESFAGDVIATFTKGTDHIDAGACRENGIKILSADEGNSQAAAEHTLAMMLAAIKGLLRSDKLVREGRFTDIHFERTELSNKKVGVIGYGSIGKRVAKLCEAFEMSVYVSEIDPLVRERNKKISFKSFNYLLKNCDIVTFHIPLENNVNFLSKEKLSILGRHSILINTSRGGIVDEDFLIKLLREKRIRFACIDVFDNEPNVNPLFFNLNNVILSNHIAGKTVESRISIAGEVGKKLYKFLEKRK